MALGSVSASVTWPATRDQIYETQVKDVPYSIQSVSLPTATQSSVYDDTLIEYSYKDPVYEWTFYPGGGTSSSASGSYTFEELEKGAANELSATLKVTCTKVSEFSTWDVVSKTPISNEDGTPATDENGNQKYNEVYGWVHDYTTETPGTAVGETLEFGPHTVYTHPGAFEEYQSLSSDTTIQLTLSSGMVANWCTHCGKWLSWKHQDDKYSDADGDEYHASSGSKITADWYNNCVDVAEAGDVCSKVSGGPNGTVIRPGLFHSLGTAISRRI